MITPAWTAPNTVSALSTTRKGGVSVAPFDSFNVGLHVGDDEQAVRQSVELNYGSANVMKIELCDG